MNAIQYTVRGVDPTFDRLLRARARESATSFNAFLLKMLRLGAGETADASKPFDNGLSAFAGTWVGDKGTDAALAEMRTVDEDLWK